LLIEGRGAEGEKLKFSKRIKDFLNPMMIAMIIGIFLGVLGWGKYLPKGVQTVVRVSGDCMAPIAMLLTGLTVGKINLLSMFKKWQLHVATIIKLLVYPLLFILVFAFLPQNSFIEETFLICGLCVVAMPSGMNAIVIPAAYGKDTTEASALALITHLLAIGSLPLCFYLLQLFVL
jgi:predicted permease